jgi:hypothetical protein
MSRFRAVCGGAAARDRLHHSEGGASMGKHIILGVHLTDRMTEAGTVQDLLTEYGCSIKTRVGFHDVSEAYCSPTGLMVLEMFGDEGPIDELAAKLGALEGVEVKRVEFGD